MAMADLVARDAGRSLAANRGGRQVPFWQRLARAMEGRGFTVTTAESVADGSPNSRTISPAFAVVDMRLSRTGTASTSFPPSSAVVPTRAPSSSPVTAISATAVTR